jgi:predicted TPR repeat methyltransferase
MPFSAAELDSEIELYFRLVRHESVLDSGPGQGKYGRMLRRVRPDIKLIGVELDAGYVEQYKLRDLYDEVWVSDAAELMNDPDCTFDALIIGDCIEHMRKSIGLDLLNFLVYRSKLIAVKFPLQVTQNAWEP